MWKVYKYVNSKTISEIIKEFELKLYYNIWHYSFNDIFFNNKFFLKKNKNKVLLFSNPLNEHSPAIVYTNTNDVNDLKLNNVITDGNHNINPNLKFWYLKIDEFEIFLKRRSELSKKPKKHFPSMQTYEKMRKKVNVSMDVMPFDYNYFEYYYNLLKRPNFYDASQVIKMIRESNPFIPNEWINTVILRLNYNSEIVAIFLVIDDNKSISLVNLATKRDKVSYGLILCTELVKYCCDKKYFSFDAGVSGIYGVYKQKIFLDSLNVINKKDSFFYKYLSFWRYGYWNSIRKRIMI